MKQTTTAYSGFNPSTSGSVSLLNGIVQGYDVSERIGRGAITDCVELNLAIYQSSSTLSLTRTRLMVLYDTQTNGAAPAVTDVLQFASPESPINWENRRRFIVLFDESYKMASTSAGATDSTIEIVREQIPVGMETIWCGCTGTVADIKTGAIILLSIFV